MLSKRISIEINWLIVIESFFVIQSQNPKGIPASSILQRTDIYCFSSLSRIFHSYGIFRYFPIMTRIMTRSTRRVTGRQGMLTPPLHLIPPDVFRGPCLPCSYFVLCTILFYRLLILNTICYLHMFHGDTCGELHILSFMYTRY